MLKTQESKMERRENAVPTFESMAEIDAIVSSTN